MGKFCGVIGYGMPAEKTPGVVVDDIVEKHYTGDIIRNNYRWQKTDKVNDDLTIRDSISVVADSFAVDNFGYMKYVSIMGNNWKIENVEVQYPRIILNLGGIYNGPTPRSSSDS